MSPHMSPQYDELWPTSGWVMLASLGHPSTFQWVSRLGSVTAWHSSGGHQPNFCGNVVATLPKIFGRVATTLGIGPHSSYCCVTNLQILICNVCTTLNNSLKRFYCSARLRLNFDYLHWIIRVVMSVYIVCLPVYYISLKKSWMPRQLFCHCACIARHLNVWHNTKTYGNSWHKMHIIIMYSVYYRFMFYSIE